MISRGEQGLCFEGRSILQLADELGTPFFLFSQARLRRNCASLRTGLTIAGVEPTLRYCIKTNNEPEILRVPAGAGFGALVSHPGEGELALAAGFRPEAIAFQRPVLLPEDIEAILDLGINLIHVYQPADIALLDEIAQARRCRLRVSLRLASDGSRLSVLGFMSRRLGLSRNEALAATRMIAGSSRLELSGINFYVGTQQGAPSGFAPALAAIMALVARITSEQGAGLEEVNIGGGIPSTSLKRATVFDLLLGRPPKGCGGDPSAQLEVFCRRLSGLFVQAASRAKLKRMPRLAAEPGRSVVGNAGVLVTRVRAIKGNWAFLDASRNYLAESPLFIKREVSCANRPANKPANTYHLSGATLNTTDVIDFRRRLPELHPGDVLVLHDAGAYSLARASRYAGLTPAAYMVGQDGVVELIRPAETARELCGQRVRL